MSAFAFADTSRNVSGAYLIQSSNDWIDHLTSFAYSECWNIIIIDEFPCKTLFWPK